MRDIATKSNTKEIIERHGFTFKKEFRTKLFNGY